CSLTRSTLLHFGYRGRMATAGNLAFPFSPSDLRAGEVYEFSVYHLLPADPLALFPVRVEEIGQ
ncbi:MAG: 3-methylaspartate ammonia-lyase, partial [Gammaproteobacteria bacterium]|nr:3-methylaspartate ammonia-lyase [Gammaproteobacteria bacterium]